MIKFSYGEEQVFRRHQPDINILGRTDAAPPLAGATFCLNDTSLVPFYIEPRRQQARKRFPYGARTPSINRLRGQPGSFNIEISADSDALVPGWNRLIVRIETAAGQRAEKALRFSWDPTPPPQHINLVGFSEYRSVQDFGQVVNGYFEYDASRGQIYSGRPVRPDSLLLLGPPMGSQEATYEIVFASPGRDWSFIGLSDFFAGYQAQEPALGIKPGHSSAGLATLDMRGEAQAWLSFGDGLYGHPDAWVVKTERRVHFPIQPGTAYMVRHQAIMEPDANLVRFRIWLKGEPEPDSWLCTENNLHLPPALPRIQKAAFGLFQYGGAPTRWSNIRVRPLEVDRRSLPMHRRRFSLIMGQWRRIGRLGRRILERRF